MSGHFASPPNNNLLLFEFYHLVGLKYDRDILFDDLNKLRHSMRAFGFNFFKSVTYISDDRHMVFPFCNPGNFIDGKGFRLIGLGDYTDSHFDHLIDAFIIPLTLIEYLRIIQNEIEKRRLSIFKRASFSLKMITLSKIDMSNMLLLRKSLMILDRMEIELKDIQPRFFDQMSPLTEFVLIDNKKPESNLFQEMISVIKGKKSKLKEHLIFLEKLQSDFVAFGNMRLMAEIKKMGLWISILLGMLTIILNIDKIIDLFNFTMLGLHAYLFH